MPLGLATVVLALYSREPEAAGKSLALPPVWEPEGAAAFAGQPALVIGGASSVGQYGALLPFPRPLHTLCMPSPLTRTYLPPAIQIAKLAGFSPIITTASPRNTALLESLGATHVLDRALAPAALLDAIAAITAGAGAPLALAYDAISLPDTQALAHAALGPRGRLVLVLHDRLPADARAQGARDGKAVVHAFGNVHAPGNRACGAELFAHLGDWLEKGVIKVSTPPLHTRRATVSILLC